MNDAGVSPTETIADRAAAIRAQFEASGVNVSEWAGERGFEASLVHKILRGERPCLRGKSHRIAVALGIKDPAPGLAA